MITNQMLGNAYVNARKYDLAIVQYQKALELHPNNPTLLYHLGWAYVYTREFDKGIRAIENHLALEGGDSELSPDLAYINGLDRKKSRSQSNPAPGVASRPNVPGFAGLNRNDEYRIE